MGKLAIFLCWNGASSQIRCSFNNESGMDTLAFSPDTVIDMIFVIFGFLTYNIYRFLNQMPTSLSPTIITSVNELL